MKTKTPYPSVAPAEMETPSSKASKIRMIAATTAIAIVGIVAVPAATWHAALLVFGDAHATAGLLAVGATVLFFGGMCFALYEILR